MIERRKPELDPLVQDFIKPEQERLLAELEDINTSHQRRSAIGERLALIGDPRPGVGLRPDGFPDIMWCRVPGGEIIVKDEGDRAIGTFQVQPFFIAKYPITYGQFQAFLNDREMGYDYDEWWRDFTPMNQKQPMREQRSKYSNHPRDDVSWEQAVAFCRWLTTRLPHDAWPSGGGTDCVIRLPTEWEWQQAATGGRKDYKYPWGKERDGGRANTKDSGIARTTAAGMYPAGASPVGALDMSGNVWEWCLNEFDNLAHVSINGEDYNVRVLRGGSFTFIEEYNCTDYRHWPSPFYRDDDFGFRVAVGLPLNDSGL
jgi:formylglycine-generating enzyme required for sulfatase activity